MNLTPLPSTTHSLRELFRGATVVAFNVGPSGDAYVVLALEPLDDRTGNDGFASFAKTVPDSPQRYRVLAVRGGVVELDLPIDGEPFNIHDVQPLGAGLLLTCARSSFRGPGDADLNGRLYSRDGVFGGGILLGDGIETIQATRDGEIWAAYFDEGVFGNHGWRQPLGAAGLVAWTATGEKLYDYDGGAAGSIVDCYALNVATQRDVWCCYYTGFPLVHLHDRRIVGTWRVPVAGSHAFAVGAGHALFAGDYDGDAFHLVRLEADGSAKRVGLFELRDDAGLPVKLERVVGRGATLHVLGDGVLHEISIHEVLRRQTR